MQTQVIEGRLRCDRDTAIRLAGYTLQSEFGDYSPERHTEDYLSTFALLPRAMVPNREEREVRALIQLVIRSYMSLQGLQPNVAEHIYINEAQHLDGLGQEGFPAKDPLTGVDVCLGVSLKGIFALSVYKSESFKWEDIANLIHQKKQFTIELNTKIRKNFVMCDGDYARFAYQVCIEQHQLYANSAKEPQLPDLSEEAALETRESDARKLLYGSDHHDAQSPFASPSASTSAPQARNESLPPVPMLGHPALPSPRISRPVLEAPYEPIPLYSPVAAHHVIQSESVHARPPMHAMPVTAVYTLPSQLAGERLVTSRPFQDNPSTVLTNVTTVQVHHEPAWDSGRHDDEIVLQDSKSLPPYKSPPDYESFIRDRCGVHSVSAANLMQYGNNFNGQHALNQTLANGAMHSQAQAPHFLPSPQQPRYKNYSDLSAIGANGQLAMAKVWPQPPPNPPSAFPITNSTPDLHSVNVYRIPQAQPNYPQPNGQARPPPSYFNSVPDLSQQNKLQVLKVASPNLINESQFEAQAFHEVRQRRYPSGSEPNLPQVLGELGAAPKAHFNFNAVSPARHLSVDTLNAVRHPAVYLSKSEAVAPQRLYERRLSEQLMRDGAGLAFGADNRRLANPQTTAAALANYNHIREEAVYESAQQQESDSHYENIEELRASLSQLQYAHKAPAPGNGVAVGEKEDSFIAEEVIPTCNGNGLAKDVSLTTTDLQTTVLSASVSEVEPSVNSSHLSTASTLSKDPRVSALESKLADSQFMREFDLLPRMNPTAKFTTALLPENALRNRFRDILPYEDNRVRLASSKDNRTGYINASHVQMTIGKMQQSYIAAQGPLASTAADFWLMIWSKNLSLIVMVTELAEENQEKCFAYFPQKSEPGKNTLRFGDFKVVCNSIGKLIKVHFSSEVNLNLFASSDIHATYVTSYLTLSPVTGSGTLNVSHIRYTDWPDHACPEDLQGFLSFLEGVSGIFDAIHRREGSSLTLSRRDKKQSKQVAIRPAPSPIVVHCSAGVGRSGAVILCDALLRSLDISGEIDVPKALTQLRFQRMISVQNFGQYKFVYRVLTQYLRNSRLI